MKSRRQIQDDSTQGTSRQELGKHLVSIAGLTCLLFIIESDGSEFHRICTLSTPKDGQAVSASRVLKAPKRKVDNQRVRWGDLVRVDFMAWLKDGTLLDSTLFGTPLVFMPGKHSVMRGMEQLVIGMSAGEAKTQQIPPELAYGCYRPELIFQVRRNWLTRHAVTPTIGMRLAIGKNNKTVLRVLVTGLTGERVTLDANHLWAGKTIMVQLELLEIMGRSSPKTSRNMTGHTRNGS